jgi:hypothetical protein
MIIVNKIGQTQPFPGHNVHKQCDTWLQVLLKHKYFKYTGKTYGWALQKATFFTAPTLQTHVVHSSMCVMSALLRSASITITTAKIQSV